MKLPLRNWSIIHLEVSFSLQLNVSKQATGHCTQRYINLGTYLKGFLLYHIHVKNQLFNLFIKWETNLAAVTSKGLFYETEVFTLVKV
jgi:hypothetical protein